MISEMLTKIHWLGHDGFRIDAEKTIYIDPYQIAPGPKADLVLITHEHFDHCSPDDVQLISTPQTTIITEKNAARKFKGNVQVMKPGDSLQMEGLTISAVPAYNTNKKFHPRENAWLGFLLEIDGVTVYHAGDTDFIEEMNSIKADIALLPVSGTYVMTAAEAAQAALAVRAEVVIPMHYGSIVGSSDDAAALRDALQGRAAVRILPQQ